MDSREIRKRAHDRPLAKFSDVELHAFRTMGEQAGLLNGHLRAHTELLGELAFHELNEREHAAAMAALSGDETQSEGSGNA